VLLYKAFNITNPPSCDLEASIIPQQFTLHSIHTSN
jgi:hypothetical protein